MRLGDYDALSKDCQNYVLNYYKNKRVMRVNKSLELCLKYNNIEESFMNAEFKIKNFDHI